MKKKLGIAAVAALLTFGIFASAEPVNVEYSQENPDYVIISGESKLSADTKVTVSVFASGKTYQDLNGVFENEAAVLPFAGITYTDADGSWSIPWKLSDSGEYDIYASANGNLLTAEPYTRFLQNGMSKVYSTIKTGTENELKELFNNEGTLKTLVGNTQQLTYIKTPSNIGLSLYNLRKEAGDGVDITSYIPLAVSLAALDDTPVAASLETAVKEIEKVGYTLGSISVYNEKATDAIKADMASRLDGCAGMELSGFDSTFGEALILSGIAKCGNWTEAQSYLDLLGNSTYENNKASVARAVVGNSYTMSELKKAIENAVVKNVVTGGGGSSGSSGGGTSSVSVSVPAPTPVPEQIAEPKGEIFVDVSADHWAYDYINLLRWKDIVCGDENGCFYPDNSITRAETVKMLCEAFDLAPDSAYKDAFTDVARGDWFTGYINAAYKAGLVTGTDGELFSPNRNITRQELAVLIYRFAEKYAMAIDMQQTADFADSDEVAEYAKPAVELLCGAGIITGMDDGRICPEAEATRAQTAVMLCRVLETGKQVSE